MNLITETKRRLTYLNGELIDLQECLKERITKDCKHHIREQLEKTHKNIEYYSEVLKVLEIKESEKDARKDK
ncbi:MAG: hypothetical protein K0R54_2102 [Clostridiaceae bacterium]|jgi:hypothetical protein|nr:hypothetical protein [Clostridiaceae bacterium]